jgi:hypothetical protein
LDEDGEGGGMNKERAHHHVGMLLFGLREAVDELIAYRRHEHGSLLDGEAEELAAVLLNLQILLDDIRSSSAPKLRLINNG